MQPLFAEFDRQGAQVKWRVCLADCQDHLTYDDLADVLYTEHLRLLVQTDILVVRPRVDLPRTESRVRKTELMSLCKRAPHSAVPLLFTDEYKTCLSRNMNESSTTRLKSPESRDEFVRWLQDKELYLFIKRSNALFRARSNFLYRAPSKRYVNMFLRVGNVQRTRQVLDAFFFWMLPYLKGRNGILTDTWSISSIAINSARLLERYRAGGRGNSETPSESNGCHVDMLSSYPDDLLPVLPETGELLRRTTDSGRSILILLSAVATGNSLARLREAIAQSGF